MEKPVYFLNVADSEQKIKQKHEIFGKMRRQTVTVCNRRTDVLPAILNHFPTIHSGYQQNIQQLFVHIYFFPSSFCTRTSQIRTYLWVTILSQDLQHRRFSALNVSHKNQFTPHDQRLCISPLLHDVSVCVKNVTHKTSSTAPRNRPSDTEASPCVALAGCPQLI